MGKIPLLTRLPVNWREGEIPNHGYSQELFLMLCNMFVYFPSTFDVSIKCIKPRDDKAHTISSYFYVLFSHIKTMRGELCFFIHDHSFAHYIVLLESWLGREQKCRTFHVPSFFEIFPIMRFFNFEKSHCFYGRCRQ